MNKCIFGTVLTYPAPTANYRGESEENRTIIQKVTDGRFEYAIISPEAMRNALREQLRIYGVPCNRERLHNEEQLAVKFSDYPDATLFSDDFFFGYLMALDKKKRVALDSAKGKAHPAKRDSIFRMNLAKALSPYRHDAIFTQSPINVDSPWKNANTSALLHRETVVTAFQYPFAINLNDVLGGDGPDAATRKEWMVALLRALSELTNVAGNHARSLFHMAPASVVIRLTDRLVPGYDSYGFQMSDKGEVQLPEVIQAIKHGDFPGDEFFLGGQIITQMPNDDIAALGDAGVNCYRTSLEAFNAVAKLTAGEGIPGAPDRKELQTA